jgi:hypothetical protein
LGIAILEPLNHHEKHAQKSSRSWTPRKPIA